MKKILFLLITILGLAQYTQAREVYCEDLSYRLELTRADIESLDRMHHDSNYKNALLRELQDNEMHLQEELRQHHCLR